MIWSLTPFFNELDVLEIRLAELDSVVDRHVIAESTICYSGEPKPLHFLENRDRFAPWLDKIEYVVVDDMPNDGEVVYPRSPFDPAAESIRWQREHWQRDSLMRGCTGMDEDDLVLLSDVDEIPRAELVWEAEEGKKPVEHEVRRIFLPQHVMYLNWRWRESATVAICRMTSGQTMLRLGPQAVREVETFPRKAPRQGWHLSYMGGAEKIQYKIINAAHAELEDDRWTDLDAIQHRMETGQDMFDRRDRRCYWVPITELPDYVKKNPEKFSHMLIDKEAAA